MVSTVPGACVSAATRRLARTSPLEVDNVTLGRVMWFHLGLQPAAGRTSAVDQVCDHKVHGLWGRELRPRQHRLQQLAHVGGRQRRHDLDFQLARQGRSPSGHLRPRQWGLGDEPHRGRRESPVRLPGPILLGLEFVPTDLRLRILKGALGDVAAATPRDQPCLRGVRRSLAQRLRAVASALASYHHPCGAWSLACGPSPDERHREVCCQPPTFRVAHLYLLPHRLRMLRQGAPLMGVLTTQHLQPQARPASPALLGGNAHTRLAPREVGVGWPLRRVPHTCGVHLGSKRAIPPGQRVAGQQVKGQAMGLDPFDHLHAPLDLRLTAALGRAPQLCAPLGTGCPPPLCWHEQGALHHRPPPAMGIGQARVDPAHIPLAQPAIRLSGGARVVRPRFLIRTFIPLVPTRASWT